jgi:hypothetical protein
MKEFIENLDWSSVIYTLWTAILLPILTYIGTQFSNYIKSKRIQKNNDILYTKVVESCKSVYETIVKDIKGTDNWNEDAQNNVKEIAKDKAIQGLPIAIYQSLKEENSDFEEYLDSLIDTALYDLKNS